METEDADRWQSDALIRFSQTLLKCKLCTTESVMLTSKKSFITHVQEFHLNDERDFKCASCPLKFSFKKDLNHHVATDHPGTSMENYDDIIGPCGTPLSLNGASHKQDKQVITYKESNQELQVMYDKHASTIIIDSKQYYYCSLCGFKFSSHTECQGHFTGSYHSQKISEQSTKRINNGEHNTDTKSRSRRKRSLPMPCRRPVSENGSDGESISQDSENVHNNDDLIPWTANNPIRFSLMQSDRKRLALSFPRDEDTNCTHQPLDSRSNEYSQQYSNNFHVTNSEQGTTVALDFSKMKTDRVIFKSESEKKQLSADNNFSVRGDRESPQDLSVKAKSIMTSSKTAIPPLKHVQTMVTSTKAGVPSSKHESISHKCHRCDAEFNVLEELCSHYKEVHMGAQHSAMGDQYFKVIWLKHLLPQFVITHESGCVSRDELLVRMAIVADENAFWGPACNKAVRETFPDSTAMRKGKFKKTYYFGITYVDSSAPSASPGLETSDEDAVVNEEDEDSKSDPGLQPNSHQEVERLVHMLPDVVQYTGSADSSVARETILGMLSNKLGDSGVLTWAGQCNKAVRQVFPHVNLKRKGKYKTTFYFGLEIIKEKKKFTGSTEMSHKSCNWTTPASSGTGPPVVNAKDLDDCKGPSHHLSRLNSPGRPITADLSFLNDIINKTDSSSNANTADKERTSYSPKSPLVSPLTVPVEANTTRGQQQQLTSPGGTNSNHLENLEKLILLHPGPFVTARIFSRRFQRIAPNTDKVLAAMTMLQGRGLGQVFTLKTGNSKAFFKAVPSKSLEVALSVLGVRFIDYQVMFSERDSKLEDSLHDRLRAFYPQPEVLGEFYNH